jgi:hypothetical protein
VYEPLFSGTSIREVLVDQRDKALGEVAAIAKEVLLLRNLDELVAECVRPWRLEPLVLDWAAKSVASSEAGREGSGQQPRDLERTLVTLIVPITEGLPALLRCAPPRRIRKPPFGFIWGNRLLLSYSGGSRDPDVVRRDLEGQEAAVRDGVSRLNAEIDAFNAMLPQDLRAAIGARLAGIRAKEAWLDDIGVPRASLEVPMAAVDVARPTARTRRRGDSGASPAEPSHVEAPVAPTPSSPSRPRRTRPRGTGYLTRAMVLQANRDLDQELAAGKFKWREGSARPYVRLLDLAEQLGVALSTLGDFLRREGLDWGEHASWPPE